MWGKAALNISKVTVKKTFTLFKIYVYYINTVPLNFLFYK